MLHHIFSMDDVFEQITCLDYENIKSTSNRESITIFVLVENISDLKALLDSSQKLKTLLKAA